MAGSAFVDTSVLLRSQHLYFADQHRAALGLLEQLLADDITLWISRQVIREYLVQITHPRTLDEPLSSEELEPHMRRILRTFTVADDTKDVTTQLLMLLKDYPTGGKQIHDANIVATMLVNGIDTLLTLNIADFKRFDDKITLVSPNDA